MTAPVNMRSKRIRRETTGSGVDRISSLPDIILLKIFSLLETIYAVQCSILSKRWRNLWTSIDNLNLDRKNFKTLPGFHEFVRQVIDRHDRTIVVNCFKFCQPGKYDRRIIEKVVSYIALSQKVQDLKVFLNCKKKNTFPPLSMDSLRSLKLENRSFRSVPYHPYQLDPATRMTKSCFKQLVSLHLENIGLEESDPFSCCPNLKNLVLINTFCVHPPFRVNVTAPTLSNLTLVFDNKRLPPAEVVVTTPKLRSLEVKRYSMFEQSRFLLVNASHRLPVLDSVTLDVNDTSDDLVSLLEWVRNAQTVAISSSMAELLSMAAPDKLAQDPSPLLNLKTLKFIPYSRDKNVTIPANVMSYLLRNTSCENVATEALK